MGRECDINWKIDWELLPALGVPGNRAFSTTCCLLYRLISMNIITGWWFQTFFIFHFIYGIINPSH